MRIGMLRGNAVSTGRKRAFLVALVGLAATLVGPGTSVSNTGNSTVPVANAGLDRTVAVGAQVTLDGGGSSDPDGDELIYAWQLVSVPEGSGAVLSGPTLVKPSFEADLPGSYIAELDVDNGTNGSAPDRVIVSTVDSAPVADAGADRTVSPGDLVQLEGGSSFDVDGDALGFSWSLIAAPDGSTAALSASTAVTPTFVADLPGTYEAELVVDDGILWSAANTVLVSTENSRPVADAGPDQSAQVGQRVQLDGSGSSDADGDSLRLTWALIARPMGSTAHFVPGNRSVLRPTLTPDVAGLYVAQLVADDGMAVSLPDSVPIWGTDE